MKTSSFSPPYTITSEVVRLVSEISEIIGRLSINNPSDLTPQLRRSNRLRTTQASLAIENISLTLEQVTAIINGKRVLGKPREIMEVKNTFTVYEKLEQLDRFYKKIFLSKRKKHMKTNKHLHNAILQIIDNQIEANDPPETKQTMDRLLSEGHSEKEAKRLIGCIISSEIFDILKKEEEFNPERFIGALNALPKLPWE